MEDKDEYSGDNESFQEIQERYSNSFSDLDTSNRKSETYEILLAVREILFSFVGQIRKIPREKLKVIAIVIFVAMFCISSLLFFSKVILPWVATISVSTSKPKPSTNLPAETMIAITKTPTPFPSLSPTSIATFTPSPTIKPSTTQLLINGCVKASQLRVREGPGTDFGLLGGILFGDCYDFSLKSDQEDGTWLGFNFENSTGWVKAEYIDYEGDLETLIEIDD